MLIMQNLKKLTNQSKNLLEQNAALKFLVVDFNSI